MLIDVRKVEKGIVEKPSISQLKTKFKFQPGKYYKHTTGHMIHCLGFLDTTIYGRALISEESCSGNFILVGFDSNFNTANYVEITEEEWLKRSDVTSCSKKMATKAVIDPEVPAATDGESSTVEASVEDISEGLYDIIDDYLSKKKSATEESDIAIARRVVRQTFAGDHDQAWSYFRSIWKQVFNNISNCNSRQAIWTAVWIMRHHFDYDVTGLKRFIDCTGDNTNEEPVKVDVKSFHDEALKAFDVIREHCSKDYDYSWAVFCNLAMPIMDNTNCGHLAANRAGAELMRRFFGYDVTGLKRYRDIFDNYTNSAK